MLLRLLHRDSNLSQAQKGRIPWKDHTEVLPHILLVQAGAKVVGER